MLAIEHRAKGAVGPRRLVEHGVAAVGFDEHPVALLALRLQGQHLFGDGVQAGLGRTTISRQLEKRGRRSEKEALAEGSPLADQPVRELIRDFADPFKQISANKQDGLEICRGISVA